jgi:tetratricopeptide (TPR) repeat protein
MDRGAPLDVERALLSALPNLNGVTRSRALLLLAEVKRETGAPIDTLVVLDQLGSDASTRESEWASVLRAEAELRAGQSPLSTDVIEHLHELASSSESARARIRAFAVLAGNAYRQRDRKAASALMASPIGSQKPSSPSDALEQKWALAMLLALCGELSRSRDALSTALTQARDAKLRNATYVHAVTGLGAISIAQSRPLEASAHFSEAYLAARELDNTPEMLRAAANSALCFRFMGDWANCVKWGEVAIHLRPNSLAGHAEVMNACNTAFALAALGKGSAALKLIEETAHRINCDQPKWYSQVLEFGKADVMWKLGKKSAAIACAARAVELNAEELMPMAYAGAYARWNALAAGVCIQHEKALARVNLLMDVLDTLDEPDQVEVLMAAQRLGTNTRMSAANGDAIISRLAQLHPAYALEIRSYGVL